MLEQQRVPSTDWDYWQSKIRGILGVPKQKSLRETDLMRPWFLVPQHDELSEDEAAELFATVRRKLLGPVLRPRVMHAIRCVRNLEPEDSLPLLYAMRHVGRERGSIGRYWPAFHEAILDGQLELRDVQVRLAPELAQVWLRLYEHTHGALYYPREGRRFIKWPLAHAGLLRDDEEVLWAFGTTLATEYGGDPSVAPLLPDDLDEFLLSLLDWLEQTGRFVDSRLARLVRKRDGTDVTIGELAQRWLRNKWEQIVKEKDGRGVSRTRLIRRYLRYDATRHSLLLVLRESAWAGRVEVRLQWGDLEVPVRTRFISSEYKTECSLMEIPIRFPSWLDEASLIVGGERYLLRLPKAPKNRGLVFRADNGRATRQWELSEEYYILLPTDQFRENMADVLFEEWVPLGPPSGEWNGYELLWVRTNDPLQVDSRNEVKAGITDIVSRLEEATQKLGLPSFGHLWRPRLYLVGGTCVKASEKEEAYSVNAVPWLEARGIWNEMLSLTLAKWDKGRDDFVSQATLELPPPRASVGQIVELWHNGIEASEGQYLLEIDSTPHSAFYLVQPPITSDLDRFEVCLEVDEDNRLARTEGLARRDLDRGELVARAWPLAELSLEISCGTWARTLSIRMDDGGEWRQWWRDLGVGGLPDGPVNLTLSWRGLTKARLVFADVPFIAEDDIELGWIYEEQKQILEVTATVSNKGQSRQSRVVILGSRPWDGQIWEKTVDLADNGLFQTRIQIERDRANWLVILPGDPTRQDREQQPWLVKTLSEVSARWYYSLELLGGDLWDTWRMLVRQLQEVSLPPGLHNLLDLSGLGSFLDEYPELVALRPKWLIVDKLSALEQLANWAPLGLEPPTILFASLPPGFIASDVVVTSSHLRPFSVNQLAKAVEREGEGEIPLSYGSRTLLSSLHLIRAANDWHFEVHIKERVYTCSKCGLILPVDEFWDHQPPIASLPCCTEKSPSFTSHQPGTSVKVYLAAPWNPGALLDCLITLILYLASGDESRVPPRAEPWLDKLEAAYYGQQQNQNPENWLKGLTETAQQVWKIIERGFGSKSRLVELGESIDHYRVGLDVVYRWLLSEMD